MNGKWLANFPGYPSTSTFHIDVSPRKFDVGVLLVTMWGSPGRFFTVATRGNSPSSRPLHVQPF